MAVVCCLGMKKKSPREREFGVGLPGYPGYRGYPTCFCFFAESRYDPEYGKGGNGLQKYYNFLISASDNVFFLIFFIKIWSIQFFAVISRRFF